MALVQIAFFFARITGWIIQPPGRIAWGNCCHMPFWAGSPFSPRAYSFGYLKSNLANPRIKYFFGVAQPDCDRNDIAAWFPFSLPFFAMSPKAGVAHPFDPISFWFIVAFTTLLYLSFRMEDIY